MGNCSYYQVELHKRPQSKERIPLVCGPVEIPYCEHTLGEFSLKEILRLHGPAEVLKCKGDESKCQLKYNGRDTQ